MRRADPTQNNFDLTFLLSSQILADLSEVKASWLHAPFKYSLPWFPQRKQPCDVSDDPGARMRTINRKWLSSKLHPIIIKAKKK